jgi:ABC-2 type transport system ATP-binding protein
MQASPASAMSDFAIATQGLTKRFGTRIAVDSLTMSVPRATVTGFVGPNGAGKTTTIRLLLGLIRPTVGTGAVLGQSVSHPSAYLPQVGALVEAPAFYHGLSSTFSENELSRLQQVPNMSRFHRRGCSSAAC